MTAALLLFFWITATVTGKPSEWKYGQEDEKQWGGNCANGLHQSPIALERDIAEEMNFTAFTWEGYEQVVRATLKNNGHSAEIRLDSRKRAEIKGAALPNIYVLDHLHFHWKSEHTIDGYRFPLELHMVHYSKAAGSLAKALTEANGVSVFAVLFDISPDDSDDFEPLVDVIKTLVKGGATADMSSFVVEDFLPRDRAGYYRYEGSLTTPQCTEGVLWNVFTDTIPISAKQVEVFEQLETKEEAPLSANYRSLQPLNDRKVFLRVSPIRDSANVKGTSLILVVLCSLSYFVMKS